MSLLWRGDRLFHGKVQEGAVIGTYSLKKQIMKELLIPGTQMHKINLTHIIQL